MIRGKKPFPSQVQWYTSIIVNTGYRGKRFQVQDQPKSYIKVPS